MPVEVVIFPYRLEDRPSFEQWFMDIAHVASLRSDCRRAKVGAVLVDSHNRIVSLGYVGTPVAGTPGCLEGACPRGLLTPEECPPYSDYSNCISVHAEENCIRNAYGPPYGPLYGRDPYEFPLPGFFPCEDTTMYVTREPCSQCWELIVHEEIRRVVWPGGSRELTQ